jgi:hypothetical protein
MRGRGLTAGLAVKLARVAGAALAADGAGCQAACNQAVCHHAAEAAGLKALAGRAA